MVGSNTYVPGTTSYSLAGDSKQQEAENLFALAWHAGFRGQDAIRAVAIAMAENANAVTNLVYQDPSTPEYSIGPWQINIGNSGGRYSGLNAAQLTDPFNNAAAAFQKYKEAGGFSPWTTFTKGTYLQYMGYATAAGINVNPGGVGDQVTAILERIVNIIHGTSTPPSGGGSTPGAPGGNPSTPDSGPYSGVMVVAAGIFFLLLGAIAWKGADAVKVIAPSSAPSKALRIAGS